MGAQAVSRIYLMDDHALVREGLRSVLEMAGHEVVGESADPDLAIREIVNLQPQILLLDVNLEDRSGLVLLMELERRKISLRTIVLTMSAQPRHVAEAMRNGAMGYVLKGSSSRELLAAIDSVKAGMRYFGTRVADLAMQGMSLAGQRAAIDTLSVRERQILELVVHGHTSAAIANSIRLSPKTVETYRSRLMAKLGVEDLPALVRFAIASGLVSAD